VHVTNTSNLPIEAFETEFPMTVERFELIQDSGGAGRFRGGLGVRREFRLASAGHVALRSARQSFAATGLAGGGAGRVGAFTLSSAEGRTERLPGTATDVSLSPGDLLIVETPGGGGFGDPFIREPQHALRDLHEGRISAAAAEAAYGIVIVNGGIDAAATARRRSTR
jgi:N-methylhydantoinase B